MSSFQVYFTIKENKKLFVIPFIQLDPNQILFKHKMCTSPTRPLYFVSTFTFFERVSNVVLTSFSRLVVPCL